MKDLRDYSNKMVYYAMLGAEKYFQQGKKPAGSNCMFRRGLIFQILYPSTGFPGWICGLFQCANDHLVYIYEVCAVKRTMAEQNKNMTVIYMA